MFVCMLIATLLVPCTVTIWPIGATPRPLASFVGSIVSCTFLIRVGLAWLKSLSSMVNKTVPPPFQTGVTLTAPTPSISCTLSL